MQGRLTSMKEPGMLEFQEHPVQVTYPPKIGPGDEFVF